MAYQKGASPIRDYALQQMTEVPGLMKSLASREVGGHGRSFDPMEVQRTLNPYNWVRYDPTLGTKHHKKDAGGWTWEPGYAGYDAMLQSDVYSDLLTLGAGQKNKGTSVDKANKMMASRLHDVGISDLDQVGYTPDPNTGEVVFYDKANGQAIPRKLKGTNSGKGMQEIYLTIDDQGRVIPRNAWKDTSDAGKIAGGLGILAGVFAPMAIGALAPSLGTVGASAAYGAGTGALTSAVGGGDVLKGALTGGLGGGLSAYIPTTGLVSGISNPVLKSAVSAGLTGAARGGINAATYGGDPLKGALTGGLTGGLGGAALGAFGQTPQQGQMLSPLQRLANAGVSAAGQSIGSQLGESIIGSPFQRLQQQQQQQQAAQRPQVPTIPSWLPAHVQQSIAQAQGMNRG